MPAYISTKYEANNGDIHFIRLSPDYAAQAGNPPAGGVNTNVKAKISKSNREFGIRPRRVILSRTVGTEPDTFKKYTSLPVLTQTAFNTATYALGETITIDQNTWIIVSKQDEDF